MTYDLLIIIRCANEDPGFIIDTYQAAEQLTTDRCKVVLSVDGGFDKSAEKLVKLFGKGRVYVADQNWGWGSGLFCLLIEAYQYFRKHYDFHHLQSIDYDTLFINEGSDIQVLDMITDPAVGLLGCYRQCNNNWAKRFKQGESKFLDIFGKPGGSYTPGEGVQGGYMTLTRSLLDGMEEKRMLKPPFSTAKYYTNIADDHLLPIFVRMCGLDIIDVSDFARCFWKAREDPRQLKNAKYKVFHPTKLTPKNKSRTTEIEIRNFFRKQRGLESMLQ